MVSNQYNVDIDAVKSNAIAQGIRLSEITLCYRGLTAQEKAIMHTNKAITHDDGDSTRGAFTKSGIALFSDKICMVLYLAA